MERIKTIIIILIVSLSCSCCDCKDNETINNKVDTSTYVYEDVPLIIYEEPHD